MKVYARWLGDPSDDDASLMGLHLTFEGAREEIDLEEAHDFPVEMVLVSRFDVNERCWRYGNTEWFIEELEVSR